MTLAICLLVYILSAAEKEVNLRHLHLVSPFSQLVMVRHVGAEARKIQPIHANSQKAFGLR